MQIQNPIPNPPANPLSFSSEFATAAVHRVGQPEHNPRINEDAFDLIVSLCYKYGAEQAILTLLDNKSELAQ